MEDELAFQEKFREEVKLKLASSRHEIVPHDNASLGRIVLEELISVAESEFVVYFGSVGTSLWSDELLNGLETIKQDGISLKIIIDGGCEKVFKDRVCELFPDCIIENTLDGEEFVIPFVAIDKSAFVLTGADVSFLVVNDNEIKSSIIGIIDLIEKASQLNHKESLC